MVIALVCLFGYALHARTRYDALDLMLQANARHIATTLAGSLTVADRQRILAASVLAGAGARVVDTDNRLLYETAPAGSAGPRVDPPRAILEGTRADYPAVAALAPAVFSVRPGDGAFRVVRDPLHIRWRVYAMPMAGESQFLVVSLPLTSIDGAVASFGLLMLLCAVLAGVATLLVGWLLARHALRPVAALTARAIATLPSGSRRMADTGDDDELTRLAITFHQLLSSQEDTMEVQQRFIAAASHELRAPLTVILANLELLGRGAFRMDPDAHALAVGEAHTEAERMARLVADLLSLARADAGVPLRREQVELDRVVLDVMGELRHQLAGQRLEIAAFEPVMVRGDPDRLKQLILILVDNAIKYTAPGGRVDISVHREGGAAVVDVRDTGVGIAPNDHQRVFERFYRAESGRSRNAAGNGLGLSIARWIADEHGGSVTLASEVGTGTTATIELPAA